ncbi:endonuclease exonuclease phosphatase family [Fusarium heterosporum]|uniref:Endonuclease exonuclease phosphatase family n=1 Tax=Fusarium heterosporum TaxID=42747 RepID=A0A8H5TQ45_FUSHE|nr:endonuclease exonuclease phosphatase family [Fusarium heterosporum]
MTQLDISPSASLRMEVQSKHKKMPLRIMTFNVRYATTNFEPNERPWTERRPKLANQLAFITAGQESPFICLQECLFHQVNEIQEDLGSGWKHIGRGRGTKPEDGEFSPIFYRSDTWKDVRSEVRWLSKTPEKPSRGWDAVLNRIVTMGEFEHRVTGTRVVVFSTHFDHIGVKAREHSAELLVKFAREWGQAGDKKASVVLIGGDFNSEPEDGAYKTITASGSGISDVSDIVPKDKHYGNETTYTSFADKWTPSRIDFLFIQEPRTAHVKTFGVLANGFDDGVRVSDHRPVVSDLDIVV